jgi:hypothetical protein
VNTLRYKYAIFTVISGILVTVASTPLAMAQMQQAFAANNTGNLPSSPCANKTNSTTGNSSNSTAGNSSNSTASNNTISTTYKNSHIVKVDLSRGPQDKFLSKAVQPCSLHKDYPQPIPVS